MEHVKVYYNHDNILLHSKTQYSLSIFNLNDLHLTLKSLNNKVSIYFLDKDIITTETADTVVLNLDQVYIYNQHDITQYKRIVFNHIYIVDIYIIAISKSPIPKSLLKPMKAIVHTVERHIKSLQPTKVKEVSLTTLNAYEIEMFITGPFIEQIQYNADLFASLFSKLAKKPKSIDVIYRGIQTNHITTNLFEPKYVSTSIDPGISINFAGNTCCIQFLYNIDVPYLFIDDYEKEYILDKEFYYHSIITNKIVTPSNTVTCNHFIISKTKLTREQFKEYKHRINIEKYMVKYYEHSMKDNIESMNILPIQLTSTPIHIYEKSLQKEYNAFNLYKKLLHYNSKKSNITKEEIDTLILYKESSKYTNDSLHFNIPLYYSLHKQLQSKQVYKSSIIYTYNTNITYISYYAYKYINEDTLNYYMINNPNKCSMIIIPLSTDVFINTPPKEPDTTSSKKSSKKSMHELHVYDLVMEQINDFLIIYHEHGILRKKLSSKLYSFYPDFVSTTTKVLKHKQYTELQYGDEEILFSSMIHTEGSITK